MIAAESFLRPLHHNVFDGSMQVMLVTVTSAAFSWHDFDSYIQKASKQSFEAAYDQCKIVKSRSRCICMHSVNILVHTASALLWTTGCRLRTTEHQAQLPI